MNGLLILFFLFFIGSLIGWGIELIFRRFFSSTNPKRRWINPGFLVGPYLPLYGFGLCILYLLACVPLEGISNQVLQNGIRFLCMAIGMTIIEYIAGILFIRGMHVKLWDYSHLWGNIQGIICPLFSFFWGILSALYYFLIHPHIQSALEWLSQNLAFSFVIGFFYGILTIDICYSLNLLAKIRKFASDNQIIIRYEELKNHIRSIREQYRERRHFIFAFRSARPFSENLRGYLEKYGEALEKFRGRTKRKDS